MQETGRCRGMAGDMEALARIKRPPFEKCINMYDLVKTLPRRDPCQVRSLEIQSH